MSDAFSITPTALKSALGISLSYASELLSEKKSPGDELAVRVWRQTGLKLGRLKERSDEDVEALARFVEGAP